jgi:hypothetical protein
LPLQTLYVNFTTQVLQALGLGYGRPAEGLMKRKPRASGERILPRPLLLWVAVAGPVLGGATLGVIAWADDHYGNSAVARTMGLTTFAISNVFFSVTTRDERRSFFSLDVLEDRTFLFCTAGFFAAILFGTELASSTGSSTPSISTCTSGWSASSSGSRSCRCPRPGGSCSGGAAQRRQPTSQQTPAQRRAPRYEVTPHGETGGSWTTAGTLGVASSGCRR